MFTVVLVLRLELFGPNYCVFVGWGQNCVADGWIIEKSDLELLLPGEEGRRYMEKALLADGIFLVGEESLAEEVANAIVRAHPQPFCLGCLRRGRMMSRAFVAQGWIDVWPTRLVS